MSYVIHSLNPSQFACPLEQIIRGEVHEEDLPPLAEYLASADERATAVQRVQQEASATGVLNRLLGNGGEKPPGLPSWLTPRGTVAR